MANDRSNIDDDAIGDMKDEEIIGRGDEDADFDEADDAEDADELDDLDEADEE